MLKRAYSLLEIKSIDEEQRIIEGIATTPTTDRVGDVIEPAGAQFTLPLPFLYQHDSELPMGHVISAKVGKDGIRMRAQIAKGVSARIDEAWNMIKAGLVRGLSVGFRAIDTEQIPNSWGMIFKKWEWLELSAVTIPCNGEATISAIKSIDAGLLAATGVQPPSKPSPGVTGKRSTSVDIRPKEGKSVKTIAEQIDALEKARDTKSARMLEIQNAVAEAGRTKDASEQEEFDTLHGEVESVGRELKDLRSLEAMNLKTAKPVVADTAERASEIRRPGPSVEVIHHKLPKGIGFVRMVSALAQTKGNRFEAAQLADSRWKESTPEVGAALRVTPLDLEIHAKTAVNAGTTSDSTNAGPLVQYQNLASEFIEYLRPLSIIGRINGFRRVPFKVKVPRQTGGATVNWVGEGKVKPLTSLAFDSVTLDFSKIAGIIPLTEELVRLSSPSAEQLVRDDLAAAITQFMDSEFIDPTNASTDVSPASITYGLSPITATGTTAAAFRADVKSMFATLLQNNVQLTGGTWVMTQQQAVGLSLMVNGVGGPLYPGITPTGGTLIGFPVVVSENIPAAGGSPADGYTITFVLPQEVLLADDGGVTIDVSREASLQMDSSPDSPFTASTVLVSLWQHNMIAIKAERFINWKVRRTYAAGLITGTKYAE